MPTIYLMRHGDAHNLGEAGASTDEERPLTPSGIAELEKQVQGFTALGEKLDACFSSPLTRALQTAGIMTRSFGLQDQIRKTEALGVGASWKAVLDLLAQNQGRHTLLVGHTPFIGQLMSKMICGHIHAATPFSKAAICRIDLQDLARQPYGQLVWFMTSRQMQKFVMG